ncbi:Gfo/Idh/MocA family protein [Pelagicoccus mobilis]|uniref:Gfo/Idh/MocA family oxidoreductase n=1 Tax=Pelagicoccus mobilis TaxID=415221 RepID=A0A934VTI1_9BACT|nr:Gfo/Idh/MocA family oxidoreductase [Pelagicoccus mobilis]MBK1879743.1 Gfo/Idh/MocA family oxidoreductase [Pelagicoccus mobilis]
MIPKVVLIGAGAHGFMAYADDALPVLASEGLIKPVGVIEPDPERLRMALEAMGLDESDGYADLDDLEKIRPDIVIVASPFFAHEEACIKAAELGAHLFIEKPVSDSLESCVRVQAAIEAAGVKAAVNMSAQFETEKRAFAKVLKDRSPGELEYMFARLSWNGEARARYRADHPYPYLNEAGIHILDMLRRCAGGKPSHVYHMAYPSLGSAFSKCASSIVSVEMDNGVRFALEGSWTVQAGISTWRNEYIRADCSYGSLLLDHQKLQVLKGCETFPGGLQSELIGDYAPDKTNKGTLYLFRRFVDWVCSRVDCHPTNLNDNMQCMALLFAAFMSADQKQVVDVQALLRSVSTGVPA